MPSLNPSDESIQTGPTAVRFLITGADSGGSIAVFEFMIPAGTRLLAPAHSHDGYEETVYGVEGVITFTVDGVPIDIGPGQALCIPRGAVHRYDNNGPVDVKGFCAVTPALLGPDFFREAPRNLRRSYSRSARPRQVHEPDAAQRHYTGPAATSRVMPACGHQER